MPFTSDPIPLQPDARGGDFARADIVVEGLEQAGPSFEGHLFLNNPAADERTEHTPEAGYAGTFHVYGQGGDAPAGEEAVAPITKEVIATDAVRAVAEDAHEVTVTVVPVARGAGEARLAPSQVSIVFR